MTTTIELVPVHRMPPPQQLYDQERDEGWQTEQRKRENKKRYAEFLNNVKIVLKKETT